MTRILAIDLGKFKSVACLYDADSADTRSRRFRRGRKPSTSCCSSSSRTGS